MNANIELGFGRGGEPATVDLEELLATRLLVQGNSGSGKSHLLRRLLEQSASLVQQVVIDPEGDFVSLGDEFGHVAIEAAEYSLAEIANVAARIREHRASVVLSLEGLELEGQMRCAGAFLGGLFDAPRDHWFAALVVVDEAQVFAPAAAGDVSEEARRASLGAMTNLMCRGRKRGLAGIIATQRLAKLAKNVAAEASNFLMGRTFLDIDMQRAADLLGMERRQAEAIRDLERGEFLALGPALSRRPVNIRIGPVRTGGRSGSPKLVPLPSAPAAPIEELLFAPAPERTAPPLPPEPQAPPAAELIRRIEERTPAEMPVPPVVEPERQAEVIAAAIRAVAAELDQTPRSQAQLYRDFAQRCRMSGVNPLDMDDFRRRLAMFLAGLDEERDWGEALAIVAALPDEMAAPFLRIARAARDGEECPTDEELARLYGTFSTGRARRMLATLEEKGVIVSRIDLSGRRSIAIPLLDWRTAAALPDPARPPRLARIDQREASRAGQLK